MAQYDPRRTWSEGCGFHHRPVGNILDNILTQRFDQEIFSTVILALPLFQEGQLFMYGDRICTILVNRLED